MCTIESNCQKVILYSNYLAKKKKKKLFKHTKLSSVHIALNISNHGADGAPAQAVDPNLANSLNTTNAMFANMSQDFALQSVLSIYEVVGGSYCQKRPKNHM